MVNKQLLFNSLQAIFFVKIQTNNIVRLVDFIRLTSKMSAKECDRPSNSSRVLCPPASVKGMTEFDKEAFTKEISCPALLVKSTEIRVVQKLLYEYFVRLLDLRPAIEISDKFIHKPGDSKCLLLNPDLIPTFVSIEERIRNELENYGVTDKNFFYKNLTITFDNWRPDDLFSAVLPDGLRFSGYTIVGHIAHFNLREDLLKYKYVLGMIVLKKIKMIETVVNKLDMIDNTYRNFKMEVICGKNDLVTTLKENSCTFQLDFSSVYWNSRLSSEHDRVVSKISSGDVVYDVFAGVGPFAIPAAKKGCVVLANDLNPDSVKWLRKNAEINKVLSNDRIKIFNNDGRDFILHDVRKHLLSIADIFGNNKVNVHVLMNLPSLAVTFLEHFKGMFNPIEFKNVPKAINVYLYCFIKDPTTRDSSVLKNHAKTLIMSHLGDKALECIKEIYEVRHVSVNKDMFRVHLTLGPEILVKGTLKRTAEMMESDKSFLKAVSGDASSGISSCPVSEKH